MNKRRIFFSLLSLIVVVYMFVFGFMLTTNKVFAAGANLTVAAGEHGSITLGGTTTRESNT